MQSIELTAKSVDEARKTAAAKLGVSPEAVQVTVIEETKGLFGKSNVRVRAETAQQSAPEPVAVAAAAPAVPEEAPAKAEKPRRGGRAKTPAGTTPTAPETMKNMEEAVNGAAPAEISAEAESTESQVVATEQDVDQLLGLVNDILKSGDLDVAAKAKLAGGRYVNIELDGKDVAFLVGKHGEVLNALQYLVNIAAARKYANGVRVTLDGNNYRERREAALSELATKIANEVKNRREEAVLDALPAFERRVVHKALAAIEGVETYSEGEEPNRRVVIAPAEA